MRIQHNIPALNTLRNLNKKSNTLEKLSSGYRVNKSADDSAGLAISEKMMAQINGLEVAQQNTLDCISLTQTAEGALTEVHAILQRIRKLSVQASNGIYDDEDRNKTQLEIDSLKFEIDKITESTNFNGIQLLNGKLKGSIGGNNSSSIKRNTISSITGSTAKPAIQSPAEYSSEIDFSTLVNGSTIKINGTIFEFDTDGRANNAGSTLIDIKSKNDAQKSSSFINALNVKFGTDFTMTSQVVSGSEYKFTMTANDSINGQSITISYGESPVLDIVKGRDEYTANDGIFGAMLEIYDFDYSKIVDGTTITINGVTFEFDADGKTFNDTSDPTKQYFRVDISDISKMRANFSNVFNTTRLRNVDDMFFTIVDDGSNWIISIEFDDETYPLDQSIKVEYNKHVPSGVNAENVVNKNGVNTPQTFDVPASRKDEIDFSTIVDGNVISIDGVMFEFDSDGNVNDSTAIKVDMSGISKDSDKVDRLALAFQESSLKDKLQLVSTVVNDTIGTIEVSSLSNKTIDNQVIDIQYIDNANKIKTRVLLSSKVGLNTNEPKSGIIFQIGANPKDILKLYIDSMTTSDLGVKDITVNSVQSANSAIEIIDNAIKLVSYNRANLGAAQNRLEHTMNNLSTGEENLTASYSRIHDADMAKEMMNFVKENILSQAVQSMMAQSNKLGQNILQLLTQI